MDGFLEQWRRHRDRWREPALTALLAVQALLLFGFQPFAVSIGPEKTGWESLATALTVLTAVAAFAAMLLALFVVSRSRWAAVLIALSILVSLAVLFLDPRSPSLHLITASTSLVFAAAMAWVIAGAVFGGGRVTYHRITGAVLLYLGIAQVFASLYELLLIFLPGSLSGVTLPPFGDHFFRVEMAVRERLVYFSFATLTTTGYGDIVPLQPISRSLANLEAILGQLYPATLLARIVTLEIESRRNRAGK